MVNTDFDRIYLNQSRGSGRMRIAESGLGWRKAQGQGDGADNAPFLLPANELISVLWSRGARGYEVRVQTKNQGVVMLDGFDVEDYNKLKQELQRNFSLQLEHKEHAMRGWNWGTTDFAKNELVFEIANKPGFEVPYSMISNSNLTGKNEVAVELAPPDANAAAGDELVEMRFYIPGTEEVEKTTTVKNDEGVETEQTEQEEVSAAQTFYDQIRDKADIGQVAGDAVVSFQDTLFVTPRGRYDIDMYALSLRLRGKTYDYKIQYKQIERIFSLPKPDDTHHLIILQIDPPLRQGQTRYPFLVMQFNQEDELEVDLNLTDEEYQKTYELRLKKHYDAQAHIVVLHCFKGLTERRVIVPGSFQLKVLQPGILCSLKALEGYLYPLDRCFLFVTKPTVYIPFSEVLLVTMLRTGGGVLALRTFDLEIALKGSNITHTFGLIDKDEQEPLERFCNEKGLRVKNEEKIAKAMLAQAMKEGEDDDDGDVDMGLAGEDELEDDDFEGGSDSDPAEEFDSDASDDSGDDEGDGEPAPKRAKN